MNMTQELTLAFKTIFSALGGAVLAVAAPVATYAAVCTLMVVADAATAWRLGRRVAADTGWRKAAKLQSQRIGAMFSTLARVYALLLLGRAVQAVILEPDVHFDLVRALAAAVCLWQALSMLENEASCRGSRWARIARRWLIDKTERHMGVPLDELREPPSEGGDA